ncbi:MAG: class I tRNA ligase family protein, partial [Planctomycetota bacterium]|nr:class I tRNA ligase family protein [Planctomycetota bacterium]
MSSQGPSTPSSTPASIPSAGGGSGGSDQLAFRYNAGLAQTIENRWQDAWDAQKTFVAPNPGETGFDGTRPKKYILDMFPYPSGVGLHVGHPLGYIATDIFARYLRMTGHNVLHTMGFDSFGLPAEQYAVQTGQHPRVTTENNIGNMKVQLRRLGLGHDPRRGVSTTDTDFYKWTQWIFLQIYNSWYDAPSNPAERERQKGRARPISELITRLEKGEIATASGKPWSGLTPAEQRAEIDSRRLAFVSQVPVNWCPMLGTVLANEEVTADGRSERGNYPVYKRPLKQWMMRITSYADRLADDLEHLEWPDAIKLLQRNWIGRSHGAHVHFRLDGFDPITVFTTRPDTLFGATYMVLSPDHPLVNQITTNDRPPSAFKRAVFPGASDSMTCREAVAAYRVYAASKTEEDRAAGKDKTGVFTGAYAINPVNDSPVPIFIADYVLSGYGTGAIMAVPAHDDRDFEFAVAMNLPIRDVVYPRPVEAMLYFVNNAYAEGKPATNWMDELADLLGVTTSAAGDGQSLESLFAIVRSRRHTPDLALSLPPQDPQAGDACDVPGSLGQRRGSMRAVWLETLDSLGITDYNDLRQRLLVEHSYQLMRGQAFTEPGVAVHSSSAHVSLDHLPTRQAKQVMIEWLEKSGNGSRATTYKLRDWLFSRQRYWGEPFPIVYDDQGVAHDLPESMLPVLLPELSNFQPESSNDPAAPVRTPLNRAADWVSVELDLGNGRKRYTRETNTMPNWAGSCWYYLRYLDPTNANAFCGTAADAYWMSGVNHNAHPKASRPGGVDLYVGGVEHAVLHLLYARFWHKVLFDLGYVSTPEPFQRLFNQGYIQAYAYKDARGIYVEASQVTLTDGSPAVDNQDKPGPYLFEGQPVVREYGKMGKSLRNAVAPDEICAQYGCDTLRVYEMSMGPLEASKPWNTRDIAGAFRFLQRVWRNLIDEQTGVSRVVDAVADRATLRVLHKTIIGVRRDMESMSFNTVVSKLIELNNHLSSAPVTIDTARAITLMLAPL